jgi:hypothetical protein
LEASEYFCPLSVVPELLARIFQKSMALHSGCGRQYSIIVYS